MEETQVLFQAEIDFVKSEGDGRRIIRGYASTENLDQQGEIILQNGLDFGPLLKSGFLNYDHQYKEVAGARMPIIVGYPTLAEQREKGLWVEGELLKSDNPNPSSDQIKLANELWELGLALQKSGRRTLSYSVEGTVIRRNGNKIEKAIVKHLAVTHKPVNPECTIEVFQKSFCCGKCSPLHPLHIPGHTCGGLHKSEGRGEGTSVGTANAMSTTSAGPLMLENLDRGLTSVLYGGSDQCGCYDHAGRFKKGMQGALVHMSECLGHDKAQSAAFMRGLLKGATKRPDIMALVKQSGIAS